MDESVDALLSVFQAGEDWEGVLFESACAGAREWAGELLRALDAALATQREPDLVVEGYRNRTVVTRMGPVLVRRRLYRQGKRSRFLLDEALGWTPGRVVSPSLQAIALEAVSRLSYREAAGLLSKLISQSVGHMTLHRLVQAIGEQVRTAEAAQRAAVYEQGQGPPTGTEIADPLFVEADGVTISLQREAKKRTEIKIAMASSGRTELGTDRHGRARRAVDGKVGHAGIEQSGPFWDGAWLTIGARYDLDHTRHVVVGGDGASWIRGALTGVSDGLFQLDRFHLAREFKRVLGPSGMVAFQAARTGDDVELKRLLAEAWQAAGADERRIAELEQLEHYLSANRDGLVDWYRRIEVGPAGPVPLGAMEANVDKPYACRFKKRGMSWTVRGAHRLAKVLQLRANGKLETVCHERASRGVVPRLRPASAATTAPRATGSQPPPFQGSFAPRWGPHASRPWVQVLCRLIDGPRMRS